MNELLECCRIALETGEWWATKWRQQNKYYEDGRFTKEQTEVVFNELIRILDSEWFLAQKTNNSSYLIHPLAKLLLMEGPYPFQILCSLGLDLYEVRKAGLLEESLVRRLKSHKEYWEAARFELLLLSHLLCHNFDIKTEHRSGKGKKGKCNCDFEISKGDETVFLEVKRPIEMNHYNEEICKKGFDQLWGTQIEENNSHAGSFMGDSFLYKPELKKVFKHILYAVNNQLPSNGTGGIIIQSPWPIDF